MDIYAAIAPNDTDRLQLEPLRKTFLSHATGGQRYLEDAAWLDAYRAFFFPQTFAKVCSVLQELGDFTAEHVVDLGSAMAPAAFAAAVTVRARHLHAVDFSHAALKDAERIGKQVGANVRTYQHDLALGWPSGVPTRPDLVLACNALSELPSIEQRIALVKDILAHHVSDRGALVLIEPADREHARALQSLRDELLPISPVAPCPHSNPCPGLERERDFCHAARELPLPPWFDALSKRAGLSDPRMRFSYLIYRPGLRSESELLRIISHPIEDKGRLRYFACGKDGLVEFMRQNKHLAPENEAFDRLQRGALIQVVGGEKKGKSPIRWKVDVNTKVVPEDSSGGNIGQSGFKS